MNKLDNKLNPNFITGLTEAEGCFSIIKNKDDRIISEIKLTIRLRFRITMLANEIELLNMVKSFFNCGRIMFNKNNIVSFVVEDIFSIENIIIPHFNKYPLRGTKYLDFLSFNDAFKVINVKEHLTNKGKEKLIKMSEEMNSNRTFSSFTDYSPNHSKETHKNYLPLTGDYISGFIAGDGCLSLTTLDKNFGKMSLQITQHINNRLLLMAIANYFKSPHKIYSHGPNSLQITLSGIKLWEEVIFDHFSKYPLYGSKNSRLQKLLVIRELILNNKHLVREGKFKKWKSDIKLRVIDIWKM